MSVFGKFTALAAASALMLGAAGYEAQAQGLNLEGETVTWIVPFSEGGGSDGIARLLAPYLEQTLPGNPSIVVLNQPGGGSITASNKFARGAETDGTVLFIGSSSTFLPVALGAEAARYDPNDWEPVMALPRGTIFYVDPAKVSVDDGASSEAVAQALRDAELVLGAKGPTSIELIDLVAMELIGADVTPVFGLSSGKQRAAFMRGELSINHDGTGPYLRKVSEQVEAGKAQPLFSYGYQAGDGSLARDPDVSDVPRFDEILTDVNPDAMSGAGYAAYLNLMNVKVSISKVIFLPEGTPQEIVDAYVAAFEAIASNPEVVAALKDEVGSLPYSFGADAAAQLAAGTQMSPEAREWVDQLLRAKYDASL